MPMDTLTDVFNSDIFSVTTLTASINAQPFVPGFLGSLGLFQEEGVSTTSVVIEQKGSTLALVETAARDGVPKEIAGDKRQAISFEIPHLPTAGKVRADEIQNVRAFGSSDTRATIESVRDSKLTKMSQSLDMTLEYHRLGACQGKIYDADGTTVLFDLADKFGITPRAEVDLNLDATYDANDPTKASAIKVKVTAILRDIQEDLGAAVPTGYLVLCSDTFWDALIAAPEVRTTYLNQLAANNLRETDGRESFRFAGCTWTNYRGAGAVAVETNKCRFIPLGVPGLFITRFAPANYMETVNTIGLPKYAKAAPDPGGFNKFIALEAQSNPLNICTRPKVLRKAKIT